MATNPHYAPDAVFSGEGGPTLSTLATDLSGQATDLTVGTSSVYENSSTRADLPVTRTVDLVCSISDTDTGYLWSYSNTRIVVASGGVLQLTVNSTSLTSYTIQNITAATREDFVISWATMTNPLRTGASDDSITDVHIWNRTLGTYESFRRVHVADASPGGGGALLIFWAQDSSGTNAFSGGRVAQRISSAYHSSIETASCYVLPGPIGIDPVFEPEFRTLEDRWSGVTGTATNTVYNYEEGSREYDPGDADAWLNPYDLTGSGLSVSLWFRANGAASGANLLRIFDSGGARAFYVGITSGGFERPFLYQDHATTDMFAIPPASADTDYSSGWFHLVFTHDGSGTAANAGIYQDGQALSLTTLQNGVGAAVSKDGIYQALVTVDGGQIAKLAVYQNQLTAAQVADIYERQRRAFQKRLEFPVPERSCGIGDDGQFVGPVLAMAAAAQRQNDMRLVGALVNEVCTGAWAEDSTWTMADPADAGYQWHGEFLRRRPVPVQCNRLVFRAQVQQNAASPQDLGIRFYSSSHPGTKDVDGSPATIARYYDTQTRNADDGTGTTGGGWVQSEPVRIGLDDYGHTYVWIGLDDGSLTDYRVRAWSVEAVYVDEPDGFGGGGGFG